MPLEDIVWQTTIEISDDEETPDDNGPYWLFINIPTFETPETLEDLLCHLQVDSSIPDGRKRWHRNYTRPERWVRALILELANEWDSKTRLANHLDENRQLAFDLGFRDENDNGRRIPAPPSKSNLWTIWENFPGSFQDALRDAAEELVEFARDEGLAAPDGAFQPEPRRGTSKRIQQRQWEDECKDV